MFRSVKPITHTQNKGNATEVVHIKTFTAASFVPFSEH